MANLLCNFMSSIFLSRTPSADAETHGMQLMNLPNFGQEDHHLPISDSYDFLLDTVAFLRQLYVLTPPPHPVAVKNFLVGKIENVLIVIPQQSTLSCSLFGAENQRRSHVGNGDTTRSSQARTCWKCFAAHSMNISYGQASFLSDVLDNGHTHRVTFHA